MVTLVVTSSWPRTGDEIAGTFVRADALTRGDVLAAVPRGRGVARTGPQIEITELPHFGMFGTPGAAMNLIAAPHRLAGLLPFARAIGAIGRLSADRVVAHWLVPSGAIARAVFGDVEIIAHGGDVRLLERFPRAISGQFLRWIGPIRAVSDDLAVRLRAIEPSIPIRVEPMPVVIADTVRTHARSIAGRFGSELQVVAARMIDAKRIDRAIDHVAAHGGRLALIGDGPARRSLLTQATRRRVDVLSPGAVPHDEALGWIAAAHTVLAPLARGEGAPTVIREANALGVPVVRFT